MRGNLPGRRSGRPCARSIPALAGEPCVLRCLPRRVRVYPRACGGTLDASSRRLAASGLSPRLRGNLSGPPSVLNLPRSIPALAGEPVFFSLSVPLYTVYPRACGGTERCPAGRSGSLGLSPRLRGNPDVRQGHIRWRGSIPALAGEPRGCSVTAGLLPVYPRACGGTRTTTPISFSVFGLSPRLRGNQL